MLRGRTVSGDGYSILMNRGSVFRKTDENGCIDVQVNVLLMHVFIRRIKCSVMIWGGISHTGRTDLVIVNGNITAMRYRDEIVGPHVVPFLRANGPGMLFQQDNAHPMWQMR